MFVPEYTITSKTLKNISTIEYAKAIVENTPILANFQTRLQKEAEVNFVKDILESTGYKISYESIKKSIEFNQKNIQEVDKVLNALYNVRELAMVAEIDEETIKRVRKLISDDAKYRQTKKDNKTEPEEILAEMSELFDWYNSLDAKETHPVIVAGLVIASLEIIEPYTTSNLATTLLCSNLIVKANNYSFGNYLMPSKYYSFSKKDYQFALDSILENDYDFTTWLEFFTENIASETSNIEQKVKLLARDSKLAKSTGRTDLTSRQERIIEYLQDYGMIQNKQFSRIFPDVSEDSVLRDLKKLVEMDIVAKRGSTKSSRYELK